MAQNPFHQQAPIPGVKHIILIGSGKGGVGKSTISANLALALKKLDYKVGLLDADIYGPSLPRMMGALNQNLEVDKDKKMHPCLRHGLKLVSMGFLIPEGAAVVWRGPMLFKAISQFFNDVQWGDLDYLVIDLPPGTGDVALTIAQKVPVSGAITVCTPQNMALIDAQRAVDMFERINIPLLGVIENMSYLRIDGKSEGVTLFPKGELNQYLKTKNISKLGELAFHPNVGLSSETGFPILESDEQCEESQEFLKIAQKIVQTLH